MEQLDVVIVTFNSKPVIEACVRSLLRDGVRPDRISVVDNASTDGTCDVVRRAFPDVRLIANRANVGFARAANLGAGGSDGAAIAFVNPDTEVLPGAISCLLRELRSGRTGACGPTLVDATGSPRPETYLPSPSLWGWFLVQSLLWRPRLGVVRFIDARRDSARARPRRVLSGAFLAVRRSAFQEVGGFDERFFLYAEDLDLCERLRQHGYEVARAPRATVVHHAGRSSSQSFPVLMRSLRARDQFNAKHCGAATLTLRRLVTVGGLLGRLLALSAAGIVDSNARGRTQWFRAALRPFLSRKVLSSRPLEFPLAVD